MGQVVALLVRDSEIVMRRSRIGMRGRNRDGSYLSSDGGSGLWIRAAQIDRDGVIDHVDGAGRHHQYRLLPLPNDRYPHLPNPRTTVGS